MNNKFTQYFFNKFKNNEAKFHELNYLFWECTQRCNLNCLHCGSDCVSNSKVNDMPIEDFLNAILPLKTKYKPNTITIVITGGEPLLRPDLAECGNILRKNGFRWGIVTNGYSYNNELHLKLVSSGMGALTLSLDGLQSSHNWLRNNKSSFNHAINTLDILSGNKRINYDVVSCVNPNNIEDLPSMLDLLIDKKVKSWRLFTIAPIGRAKNNFDLQLSRFQLIKLMEFISNSRLKNKIDIKFSCEAYLGNYEKKARDSYFFCRAGINIASVLIDGSISACPNINRAFVQGNIYKNNLLDIWEYKFEIMRNRQWTKVGICADCVNYKNCNGGAMHLWNQDKDNIITCINNKIENNNLKVSEPSINCK